MIMNYEKCKLQSTIYGCGPVVNWKNVSLSKYYNLIICIVLDLSYNLSIIFFYCVFISTNGVHVHMYQLKKYIPLFPKLKFILYN